MPAHDEHLNEYQGMPKIFKAIGNSSDCKSLSRQTAKGHNLPGLEKHGSCQLQSSKNQLQEDGFDGSDLEREDKTLSFTDMKSNSSSMTPDSISTGRANDDFDRVDNNTEDFTMPDLNLELQSQTRNFHE